MQTSCSGGAESIEEHCLLNIVWRYFRVYLVAISDLTAPAVGPQFNHLCVHLLIPVWTRLNSNENTSSYPYWPSEVADNQSRSNLISKVQRIRDSNQSIPAQPFLGVPIVQRSKLHFKMT